MTNRREFLQIGVTATAWPLVARAVQAAGLETAPQWTPISAVVYDTRFADSVAFAHRSASLGLTTHPIDADMTRLWYDEIYHRWQQGPAAIAGLTAYGPMFCFAELARDVRMRIVFKAEHRTVASAQLAHGITGPVSMVSDAVGACDPARRLRLGDGRRGVALPHWDVTRSARHSVGRRRTVSPDEDALLHLGHRARAASLNSESIEQVRSNQMAVPPGVSEQDFKRALERFARVVGNDWVFTSDDDVALYRTPTPRCGASRTSASRRRRSPRTPPSRCSRSCGLPTSSASRSTPSRPAGISDMAARRPCSPAAWCST